MTDEHGEPYDHIRIGEFGERVAAAFLRSQGVTILKRNFRGPRGGEVDIIARHCRLLLFIEVKTRRKNSRIRPLDAIDRPKQLLIERGANAWLRKLGTRKLPWRFDAIEVLVQEGQKPETRWITNIF